MKLFLSIIALTASLSTTAMADLGEDVKPAVDYLNMLNRGNFELADRTALSPHCDINRRKQIKEQLEFYYKTNLSEGDVYTLEAHKTEGNFAALLLRSVDPVSPLSIHIHPIAMLKRDDAWLPAPLPGSFANTGYGYDPEVEKTVKSLENWMNVETLKRETAARKKASTQLMGQITERMKTAGLENISPQEAVLKLISALREKDLLQTLAITGAATPKAEEPLISTLDYIARGLEQTDPSSYWFMVSSRSVIPEVMKVDEIKKEIALGFWNPIGKTEARILYFPYFESDGRTFVNISQLMKIALLREDQRWRQHWRHRRGDETALEKKLPAAIFENNPTKGAAESAQLMEAVLNHKQSGTFSQLIPMLPSGDPYFEQDDRKKSTLSALGNLWRRLMEMDGNPMRELGVLQEKDLALAPLQFAKSNRPGEFETIKVWMIRQQERWYLIPEETLAMMSGKDGKTTMAKLDKKLESIQKEQQEKQSKDLLGKVITLTPPLTLDPVSDTDAKKLVKSYRKLLKSKEMAAAMGHCAVLEGTNSAQTLKIFNYAIRGANDQAVEDLHLGINRSGKWLGLSLRTTSKSSGLMDYPLYLIAHTEQGGKIMLDIDLREATNRGRELLNAKTWRKLKQTLPESSLADIEKLFKLHSQLSRADIAKNQQEEEE
ncbi:hypothetical protein JIN77_12180 [Verrucomicrobiaceae bacterium R5-34]|uniref:Uncharacterized protein n=1 Tax=Oceaniferula flava TaxID=2800421 RepID=A0AAE2SB96_9BACT|nr:hypothetical protein [Oceaniferula flavus]MBK1831489.1 hypothetical protein [Verrucomicrobiaceae bacterium R5-34]MBK1854272.1 hypothetical protein [Oceaniferula flavus]MBM1135578.1 hypothetical protein [Oceaniferula flavus]